MLSDLDADGGGHGPELCAQKLRVRTAHICRIGELDVLTRLQNLQGAGFQSGERDAVGIRRAFTHQVVLGVLARDETGKHRGSFLAHQFGVVVLKK